MLVLDRDAGGWTKILLVVAFIGHIVKQIKIFKNNIIMLYFFKHENIYSANKVNYYLFFFEW